MITYCFTFDVEFLEFKVPVDKEGRKTFLPLVTSPLSLSEDSQTAKQLPNINIYMYIVNYLVCSSFDNKVYFGGEEEGIEGRRGETKEIITLE